ncbi:hypothetical protein LO763_19820 [Glycomyces sp. A-F 0318]|uniref:hypothetical protein n=1 Tax=Glycomyces amatae TaxID=2881355 RepID=UPI001E62059D|nr:hypothetical protein [Glycomyces amatae]MCD0445861.1 hypothetical protein [Glycomyces amatae]
MSVDYESVHLWKAEHRLAEAEALRGYGPEGLPASLQELTVEQRLAYHQVFVAEAHLHLALAAEHRTQQLSATATRETRYVDESEAGQPWTDAEDDYLREHWDDESVLGLALETKRTTAEVVVRLKELMPDHPRTVAELRAEPPHLQL